MTKTKRPTKEVLLSLYRQGLNDAHVARAFGVNPVQVWRWRKQYGIELEHTQVVTVKVKGE